MSILMGSNAVLSYGPHADFKITGDMTFMGHVMSAATWADASDLFVLSTSVSTSLELTNATESLATNALFHLFRTGADDDNYTLSVRHEYGAGTNEDVNFDGISFFTGQWYAFCIVRDTAAKTYTLYTPMGSQSKTYTNDPATSAASYYANIGTAGASNEWEAMALFDRAFNSWEAWNYVLAGYAPNQANYGSGGQVFYTSCIDAGGKSSAEQRAAYSVTSSGTITEFGVTQFLRLSGYTALTPGYEAAVTARTFPSAITQATAATNYAGTFAALTNPNNVLLDDGTAATFSGTATGHNFFYLCDFDFSAVPAGALYPILIGEMQAWWGGTSQVSHRVIQHYASRSAGVPSTIGDYKIDLREPVVGTNNNGYVWVSDVLTDRADLVSSRTILMGSRVDGITDGTGSIDYMAAKALYQVPITITGTPHRRFRIRRRRRLIR